MSNNKFLSLNKAIFEQIDLPDNAVVADLGCKDAGFLVGLQQAFPDKIQKAIGVDITDKWFKDVKYKKTIKLKVMDCSKKLKFPDNSFDFVFSADMFECVSDKELLVNEIHRILKPGGTVICVNCDWESIAYNGENKKIISKSIHAYAVTKQPWMDDLDSWIGRRMYGIFNKSNLFESSVSIHNVVETEYSEGLLGYELSKDIAWLFEENTGELSKEEYNEFIENLAQAQLNGSYIFSKPYYIYKHIQNENLFFMSKQIEALEFIRNNKKIILSAPTSFGKTLILKEYIYLYQPDVVVFIVPTNALAYELESSFKSNVSFNEYEIFDKNKTNDKSEIDNNSNKKLFIGTQEKFLEIRHTLDEIDLFIIDEAYKLEDNVNEQRAYKLSKTFLDSQISTCKKICLLSPNADFVGFEDYDFQTFETTFNAVDRSIHIIDKYNKFGVHGTKIISRYLFLFF